MKAGKRTILWIVPIAIIGIFYYVYGPKDKITEHEAIDYMKQQVLIENSTYTVAEVLQNVCEDGEWIYFETQKGQSVVEYKGECDEQQPINMQFLIQSGHTSYELGALLVNHVQQTEEERQQYIEKVYLQAS